jgi:CubicO group peptidase (beta-lactamase class C family)
MNGARICPEGLGYHWRVGHRNATVTSAFICHVILPMAITPRGSITSATGRSPGSLCWAGLSSYPWIDPAKRLGDVYVTQIFPFGDRKSLALYLEFESAVYRSMS